MDRDWLEEQLRAGRSIEAIAREVGRHPSSVGYWVRKHGLRSTHAERHAARGGVEREELTALVGAGLAIRAIAARLGVSYASVRHWLEVHDLHRARARRLRATVAARGAGASEAIGPCHVHGPAARLLPRGAGFRCEQCRLEAVTARRRRVKEILVAEAGGACRLCGFAGVPGALHFHHVDPASKSFTLAGRGTSRSLARARAEAAKCVLLWANCHAAVEAGDRELGLPMDGDASGARLLDPG
jgi:transposase